MTRHQTLFGPAVALMLVAGLIWWQASRPPQGPLPQTRIAVSRTPLSAPVYLAHELGYFRDAGLQVELLEVIGGNRSFDRMQQGEAEFGTSSDSVIMFNGFKGNDFVNLATFVQSDNDVKVITRTDSGISRPSQLAGRKVATVKGTASEYFLHSYLAFEGTDPSLVELVGMAPEDMPEALDRGAVDAIAVWEPYGYQATQRLGDRARVLPTKNLYAITFNLVTRRQYAATHPDIAERVIRALHRATDFINHHQGQAQELLQTCLKLNPDFIDWIWDDYLFKLSLGRSLLLTLENEARWAVRNGLAERQKIPDFRALMDPAPLYAIAPAAVSVFGAAPRGEP